LLSKYREVLNKEIEQKSLSSNDLYVKSVYNELSYRAKDYRVFSTFNGQNLPSESEINEMKSLLDFIYCPEVNKIPMNYPLTKDGCVEMYLTWMKPFEVPEPQNYSVPEEYELVLKQTKDREDNKKANAIKCCDTSIQDYGADCSRFRGIMQ
jgi:hypothetical protein